MSIHQCRNSCSEFIKTARDLTFQFILVILIQIHVSASNIVQEELATGALLCSGQMRIVRFTVYRLHTRCALCAV
jgi:hypothetical protein